MKASHPHEASDLMQVACSVHGDSLLVLREDRSNLPKITPDGAFPKARRTAHFRIRYFIALRPIEVIVLTNLRRRN
jgi:hypothetical protein